MRKKEVLHALRLCVRGGWLAASVLRIPTRRETTGKNVKDNGMCRVAHAWLHGMRPRNGTSVSHGVCHETRGLIARNRLSRRACIMELRVPFRAGSQDRIRCRFFPHRPEIISPESLSPAKLKLSRDRQLNLGATMLCCSKRLSQSLATSLTQFLHISRSFYKEARAIYWHDIDLKCENGCLSNAKWTANVCVSIKNRDVLKDTLSRERLNLKIALYVNVSRNVL